jgi:hypothetical protein
VIGITFLLFLLVNIFVGCTSIKIEDRFVGTWETEDEVLRLVIHPEGKCEFMRGTGTWEIKNDSLWLVIRFSSGKNTMSYYYSFSDDYKILTLSDTSGSIWVYTKQ